MRLNSFGSLTISAAFGSALALSPALASTSIRIDVNGASGTWGKSVNVNGDVAGGWWDSGGVSHGFLRTADGTITTFDPAGSTGTNVTAINDNGWIVGYFSDVAGTHGFVRKADGTITTFDAPGGTGSTYIFAINNTNEYAGYYDASGGTSNGFLVDTNSVFTGFSIKGARYVFAYGVNDHARVAGEYFDGSAYHGYVRATNGKITSFDVPGASATGVNVAGIDNAGVVAGTYYDNGSVGHAYTRAADGTLASFQIDVGYDTEADAISSRGAVSGTYYDSAGHYYAFYRTATGHVVSFGKSEDASSINASFQTTGYFWDNHSKLHGFLRTP